MDAILKVRGITGILSGLIFVVLFSSNAWAYGMPQSHALGKKFYSKIQNISQNPAFDARNLKVSKKIKQNNFTEIDTRFHLNRRSGRFAPDDLALATKSVRHAFTQRDSGLSQSVRNSRFSSGISTFKSTAEVFREGDFSNRNLNITRKFQMHRFDAPAFNFQTVFAQNSLFRKL